MNIVIQRRERLDVPDGINIHIFTLANQFAKEGHSVTLLSTYSINIAKVQDIFEPSPSVKFQQLIDSKSSSKLILLIVWLIWGNKIVRRLNPDLLIVNGAVPIFSFCKRIFVSHDLERKGRFERANWLRILYKRIVYQFADDIFATTSELKTALASELRKDHNNIRVVPTCFELTGYLRQDYQKREDAILHISTVNYKNPISTIKAFALMRRECKLYITGKRTEEIDVVLRKYTEDIISKINFLGYLSKLDLITKLSNVKVVSVPSIYNLPVASPSVIEAFASGTPVVTTNSISKDVVKDNYNAFVVDAGNVGAMAGAFDKLLGNQEVWNLLSQNALKTSQSFDVGNISKLYLNNKKGS